MTNYDKIAHARGQQKKPLGDRRAAFFYSAFLAQTQLHFDPEQYQRLPGGQLWASAGMIVPSKAMAESAKISFFIESPMPRN